MPPRNYRTGGRRSRTPGTLFAGLGLVALMGVGIVGTLWIAGVPLNPFASREPVEDPFMVRIPINSQPIPAYTRVNRTQLINPATGGLMYQRVPPQAAIGMSIVGVDQNGSHVESRVEGVKNIDDDVVFVVTGGAEVRQANTLVLGGAVMNVNAIIGRVVKADKRAGLGFQETTFFPQGTPEGLAGATPQGMRAITLDATRLTGVHSLNAGDRIDLLASFPLGEEKPVSLVLPGQSPVTGASAGSSEPVLLAQNGIVLKPVYVRNEATTSSSLTQGKRIQNVPKYEVAVAVAPDDVIPLQNALNQELTITCVAHSMKPADAAGHEAMASDNDEVRVPVTVRPILAYQVVSRDAFVSPATRTLKTESISRQEADRVGAITSLSEALGAIVRQDIPTGRYLRRSDLLDGPPVDPALDTETLEARRQRTTSADSWSNQHLVSTPQEHRHHERFVAMQESGDAPSAPAATAVGDRPAITRFIPAGRTAFAIPVNRIYGAEHLQIGDSIDLMASYSLERLRDEEETETRPDGTVIVRKSESLTPRATQRTWEESFGNRAEPWFVASGAIVIAPVGFPPPASALRAIEASGGSPANQDGNVPGFDGPPVIIAVENRDVEAVATALATRDALFTVAIHAAGASPRSPGRKTIAIAPESIGAFSALDETSFQGNRRRVATRVVFASDSRFANALTPQELSAFYGRVLKNDKPRGDFFTSDDFMPVGTQPGIASIARVGFTLLPIADREIEGIDSFVENDRVAILLRGVVKSAVAGRIAAEAGIPTSAVVAESVRIARGSSAGHSVLEVRNEDLTRLQAAMARSLTDRDQLGDRSHLIAVGISREASDSTNVASSDIPSFDPLENIRSTEIIIGGKRTVEHFGRTGL